MIASCHLIYALHPLIIPWHDFADDVPNTINPTTNDSVIFENSAHQDAQGTSFARQHTDSDFTASGTVMCMKPEDAYFRDSLLLRKHFQRFRILVIGRSNAGKTTLLQRLCGTTDQPRVFDGEGNQVHRYFGVIYLLLTSHQIDAAIVEAQLEVSAL